jgi:hypothetical protein
LIKGGLKITEELIEAVKRNAPETWTPYEYHEHPFKDEENLMYRTGLIIPE